MQRLIALSLIIIPFISIVTQDVIKLKSALAFVVMLAIGLLSFYTGEIKKFSNKFALILVGFVWLNIMMSPSSGVELFGMKLMQFWSWEPFCYILAYTMGIVAISSLRKLDVKLIFKTMVWVGFLMSLLLILQLFCLDQFFRATGSFHEQWNLGGTLGHPTFVSPFIAMIIPLAFYLRKQGMAYTMILGVTVTQSQVAIGAMVLSLGFYFACKGRKQFIAVVLCTLALSLCVVAVSQYKPGYITSSGRFYEWKRIAKVINTSIRPNGKEEVYGKYPITGLGLGSFYYTYHIIQSQNGEPCQFKQAHNEYLEWLYNCGIIGLVLLLLAIGYMYQQNFNKNEYRTALLSSFTCIAISAGGMFVWQMGPHCLYTAVIIGLLHNEYNVGE